MLRHVVMFKFVDGVDDAAIDAIGAGLDALPAAIPAIRDYRHGRDVGINAANFDYVVVADFDDEEGYLAYRDDPTHRAFIDEHITGTVGERAAVQYRLGP